MIGLLAAASAICTPFPDADVLWADKSTRWVIVGEDHSTNEQPEAFSELVCGASEHRRVLVALEQPVSEQASIDAYIRSNGGPQAKQKFLKSQIWLNGFKDGRSSTAQFQLFDNLRRLYKAGRIAGVFAFQPVTDIESAGEYEKVMGLNVRKLSEGGNLVLALVGNVHAMRTPVSFSGPAYMPMAGTLPKNGVVSALLVSNGGDQWACTSPTECGVSMVGKPEEAQSKKAIRNERPSSPYSVKIYLGSQATASPPEIPQASDGSAPPR